MATYSSFSIFTAMNKKGALSGANTRHANYPLSSTKFVTHTDHNQIRGHFIGNI